MPNAIESLSAKVAGTAGAAAARAKGLTGVFNKLAEQHKEVAALLQRAEIADEPEKRKDLWSKIRVELLSHEQGELREVYPAFDKHVSLRDIVEEHGDDADLLEATIQEIDGIDFASEAWPVALKRLITAVKQHAEEEEKEFFPRAQDVLGKNETKSLEERFLAAQESVKKQLR
jgi:hemerythrin HHE cation binding domain-containing protein